jgi:hypothetical protein
MIIGWRTGLPLFEYNFKKMNKDIEIYNDSQTSEDKRMCDLLAQVICDVLPDAESKIWHAHPVWFLEGNPIVGYSKLKKSVQLLFWSGQSFDEAGLTNIGNYQAAGVDFTNVEQILLIDLRKWLQKSKIIQWDYKNITKRKGQLERLK